MNADPRHHYDVAPPASRPFRRAVLRGLAVLMPPLLTVLILIWAINTTRSYFLQPVTSWAREALVWRLTDAQENLPLSSAEDHTAVYKGQKYRQLDDGEFIPLPIYEFVRKQPGVPLPVTADDYFRRYIDLTYLKPHVAIPLFLAVFVLLLYLLGKFMAVGIGVMFAGTFERVITRVPVVRAVYSSVKQVSDFIFTQRDFRFTRVVAVEFPRQGVWSIGFVTSDCFASVSKKIDSPVINVFVPYAPVPVTGCIITVPIGDCLDLDITFDQAVQFIMSCGVVVPPRQLENEEERGEG